MSRKNWGVSKVLHFSGNLVCAGLKSAFIHNLLKLTPHLDRHPGDMEAKGKEAFFALEPLEADGKLALGDGEGVPQV